MDSEAYQAAISRLALPRQVSATKRFWRDDWGKPESRDIAHDFWLLENSIAESVAKTAPYLSFDVPIGPNMRLSDPSLLPDALTKRIICSRALLFGIHGRPIVTSGVVRLAERFDWITRWKHSLAISTSDIQALQFDDFDARIKRGVLHLVPILRRLADRTDRMLLGDELFTTRRQGELHIVWSQLADDLGVTQVSLSDPEFRANAIDHFAGVFPAWQLQIPIGEERNHRSGQRYDQWLSTWSDLYKLSEAGFLNHDPLTFNPFQDKTVAERVKHYILHEGGKGKQRTPTLPPGFLLQIMDRATIWVFRYADWIINAVEQALKLDVFDSGIRLSKRIALAKRLNKKKPQGAPDVWPSWRNVLDQPGKMSLQELLSMLLTACGILISAFSARRINETLSARLGCLTEVRKGIFELSLYIEKTIQAFDSLPVPSLLAGVIKVLEKATKRSRSKTGSDKLFEIIRSDTATQRTRVGFDFNIGLKKFVEFHELEAPEELEDWSIASHQLRRGFAITYYYGFELSSLDALSWLLRHFNPEMTRYYIRHVLPGKLGRLRDEIQYRAKRMRDKFVEEEEEWINNAEKLLKDMEGIDPVWEEERSGALVRQLFALMNRTDKATGRGAKRLMTDLSQMIEHARARVRIGSRSNSPEAEQDALVTEYTEYSKTHILEPTPGGMNYCHMEIGNEEDEKTAKCIELGNLHRKMTGTADTAKIGWGPDLLFGGMHPCFTCDHCVLLKNNRARAKPILAEVKQQRTNGATSETKQSADEIFDEIFSSLDDGETLDAG